MYKPKYSSQFGYDPLLKDNLERCKGRSVTVPNQGVDITQLMQRANEGLPLHARYLDPLDDQEDSFDSPSVLFGDHTEEFEYYTARLAELQAYREDLKKAEEAKKAEDAKKAEEAAKQAKQSKAAESAPIEPSQA